MNRMPTFERRYGTFSRRMKGSMAKPEAQARKPTRGCGVSVTLPTEPLAGDAKTTPIMAVMVQDEGTPILEYEIKEGQSIQFRVGGTVKAFMERVSAAPDGDMFLDADGGNVEPVTVEYEHALSGAVTVSLQPGQRLSINPVMSRHWTMAAENWE